LITNKVKGIKNGPAAMATAMVMFSPKKGLFLDEKIKRHD